MARYELDCTKCGGPHEVSRRDAKYCPSCFLLSSLEHVRGKYKRARRCRTCGEKFRPAQPRDLAYCGRCDDRQHRDTDPSSHCKLCNLPHHHKAAVGLCRTCLKHPATQDKIVRMLMKGQENRRGANASILEAQANGTPHLRKLP